MKVSSLSLIGQHLNCRWLCESKCFLGYTKTKNTSLHTHPLQSLPPVFQATLPHCLLFQDPINQRFYTTQMHSYKESTGLFLCWGRGKAKVCLRCRIFALRQQPCWLIYYLVAATFFRFLHVFLPCLLRILIYKDCPARTFITDLTVKTNNPFNSWHSHL
jgi:hypothetical protein